MLRRIETRPVSGLQIFHTYKSTCTHARTVGELGYVIAIFAIWRWKKEKWEEKANLVKQKSNVTHRRAVIQGQKYNMIGPRNEYRTEALTCIFSPRKARVTSCCPR